MSFPQRFSGCTSKPMSYYIITLIQANTLIHGGKPANLFSDTYQLASNIQVAPQLQRGTGSQLRIIGKPDDIPPVLDSLISYEKLISVLFKLKLKKSLGPDCITNEMIINHDKLTLYKLLEIYNHSWEEGLFPQCWRESILIPIHNSGKTKTEAISY